MRNFAAVSSISVACSLLFVSQLLSVGAVAQSQIWVDYTHAGVESGTETFPYDSTTEGVSAVNAGGEVFIQAGTSMETPTLSDPSTITALGGTVTIGVSSPDTWGLKAGYAGSTACNACHSTNYSNFLLTGHAYTTNEVVDDEPPYYPYPLLGTAIEEPNVPLPPVDWDESQIGWNEVSYVVGGFGWKAFFMDSEGYIMTDFATDDAQGHIRDTQWNPPTPTAASRWVSYSEPSADQAALGHAREPHSNECGRCHTTGWEAVPDGLTDNFAVHQDDFQDGLAGVHGTWSEPGVRCEECHGPGAAHVASPSKGNITRVLASAPDGLPGKRCGECHTRDSLYRVEASGDAGSIFLRNAQQYPEMLAGPHAARNCVDCHKPHQSARYTPEVAIKFECTTCHGAKSVSGPMSSLNCTDCHMPSASKSAITYSSHKADVRSHLFRINPAAVDAEEVGTGPGTGGMFYTDDAVDGKLVSNGWLTLDFACNHCHGVSAGNRSISQLSSKATGIHN